MNKQTFLPFVNKPGRYLGREFNVASQQPDETTLIGALIFPDLYEIGMSHQGLQILYHLLNREPGVVAERCYCPDIDAEQLMRSRDLPLCSLESGRPLSEFDFLGITLPHELCYTNILTILERGRIPLLAAQRGDGEPLVIGGGACALNPEPVADFFDAILLGDGEEAIVEIAGILTAAKRDASSREDMLRRLEGVAGLYIPAHYRPHYDADGRLAAVRTEAGKPPRIGRRIVADLDATAHLHRPIVPNARIVHDRLGVEIARGCTRGCRFCQAGIIYRPVRERSVEQIMELAENGIANSGFEELALLSLSTGDYSCLPEVLPRLMNRFADEYVSVSMPSMRVGTLSKEVMDEIRRVRKTGFTLAPEAGSERLRSFINKGISEQDLLTSAREAFDLGWNLIKLYFMIGLPSETLEDVDAIVELAAKTGAAGTDSRGGRRKVTVSVGTFVPKPHTPFQWARQLTISESRERINRIRSALPKRGFNMKWHDPEQSYLEGVFSRGDRRLGNLIVSAWQQGARLDSWSDHFNLERWRAAAETCGIDLDFYLRERGPDELLPWSHLDSRVAPEFLAGELEAARTGSYTPDCRYHGCQGCGLCDFETIAPVVHNQQQLPPPAAADGRAAPQRSQEAREAHFKYLVSYSRTGRICYLGHLEILQIVFRALRRAAIKTNFSQGFNPSPKVSFAAALPVGTESLCEFFLIDLPEPLEDLAARAEKLSAALPDGLEINTIEPYHGRLPQDIVSTYEIETSFVIGPDDAARAEAFMEAGTRLISRTRKGKTRQLDIRPMIASLSLQPPQRIVIEVIGRSGSPGIKPIDALEHILERPGTELLDSRVRKTAWAPLP